MFDIVWGKHRVMKWYSSRLKCAVFKCFSCDTKWLTDKQMEKHYLKD